MRVELHILWAENGVACIALLQRDLVAQKRIGEEIEVIAVGGLVVDAAVAFVAVEINEVWVVLAIVESVCCARVALLEQKGDVG